MVSIDLTDVEEYPEGTDSLVRDKKDAIFDKLSKDWILRNPSGHEKILFPYEDVRKSQEDLINDIHSAVNEKKHIVAHAPTGLGKTIASLGPALEYAIRNKKTLFFLTSRHTQHIMAIKTARDIKSKYDLPINVLDIIGKKSMCLQPGIENLSVGDFSEYCKNAKKNRTCEYFNNTKKKEGTLKIAPEIFVEELGHTIMHTEEIIDQCSVPRYCPYEIAMSKGETANLIISDYYYIFHPRVRENFFRKLQLNLDDCVVIVDEAHNLPDRIKSLATTLTTNLILERSISEALKHGLDEALVILRKLQEGLDTIGQSAKESPHGEKSRIVSKIEFDQILDSILPFTQLVGHLETAAELVREKQRRSYIGSVANFIVSWQDDSKGFSRIYSEDKGIKKLAYECLDPSSISIPVFKNISSGIVISGTLEPTEMYKDLLGIPDAIEKSYPNPFPEENSLNLIVPITTTKFTRRTDDEYQKIARECAKIVNAMSGNCAIFFPSYFMRDKVYRFLRDNSDKEFILELPGASKEKKSDIIKSFTRSSLTPKVLLGTSQGSFGEGIDLPGHFLTCVIVVGLPLKKPTLEVRELIDYYDTKFGKGWDYGYFFPSFNTTFQNVGRCIRSETDKGVIVYLDERYAESRYLKYFKNRPYQISYAYLDKIKDFNKKNKI